MLKRLIITAAAMSVLLMVAGCNGNGKQQQQMPPPTVIVIAAHTDNVTDSENFVGKVDAAVRASIGARVSGFLEKRLVREGDMVKKDQILFTIEKSQYVAAVRQAEASLAQARANLNNAKLQKDRGEALLKSASISQANYDNLNAAYLVAQANTAAAQAALDNARLNL